MHGILFFSVPDPSIHELKRRASYVFTGNRARELGFRKMFVDGNSMTLMSENGC